MPFKSKAQMRKFAMMVKQGKISQATFDEWAAATHRARLPERVGRPDSRRIGKVKAVKTIK